MRAPRPVSILTSVCLMLAAGLAWSACTRTSDVDPISKPADPAGSGKPTESPKAIAKSGKVPDSHRERGEVCKNEPKKGDVETAGKGAGGDDSSGTCKKDSECTAGKNGRCALTGGGGRRRPTPGCVYDSCFADADCGAKSECVCSSYAGTGNACRSGNCATDADCGSSYCSPSFGLACGAYHGVQGNFCHGPSDECTNDSDCTTSAHGYCAYSPEAKHWVCSYSHCVG